jgi:hypothetical protein
MFIGIDNLDVKKITHAPGRGHSLKLAKQGCKLNSKNFSFSLTIENTWNCLPEDIEACNSVNSFNISLDYC